MVGEWPIIQYFIGVETGGGGGGGALAPPILGIMCIKYAEFILDTPFGPPQSCLRSYTLMYLFIKKTHA